MTLYVSNRDGDGKTDEKGHYKFPSNAFAGSVVFPGLQVTQNSPLGMSVIVTAGDFRIDTGDDYAYTGWSNVNTALTVTTADAANPRRDVVVVYVDKSASTASSPPNNPGVAKFKVVAGAPAPLPTAPNSTAIQASVGAGNPYIILANILVAAGATTITNAAITDLRTRVTIADNFVTESSIVDSSVTVNKLASNSVTTAKVVDANITTAKLADGTVTTAKFKPTIINSNFTPAGSRFALTSATTVPVPNCSMTYTAGPTNETIIVWLSIMAYKSSGNGEIYLYVNGSAYGTNIYVDSGSPWVRGECVNIINVNANSSTTLAVYAQNAQASTTLNVTNEVAKWVPTIRGFSIYRP